MCCSAAPSSPAAARFRLRVTASAHGSVVAMAAWPTALFQLLPST
jgi:hypothetical protein